MTATLELLDCAKLARAWVYVLDCDHGVKVGITTQGIESRCKDFERGFGTTMKPLYVLPCRDRGHAYAVEQWVHADLEDSRTVGEWFHCHPLEAVAAVKRRRAMTSSPPSREVRMALAAAAARLASPERREAAA